MSSAAVDVIGLNKLVRQLKNLEPELLDELKADNKALAGEIRDDAEALAPKVAGTLASTIRAAGTTRTGIVRAGSKKVPWAGPQHFGWRAMNIEPQPFLYDALDGRADEVKARYLASLNKITSKIG